MTPNAPSPAAEVLAHCVMAAVCWTVDIPLERNENFSAHVEKVERAAALVGITLKEGWHNPPAPPRQPLVDTPPPHHPKDHQ